MDQDDDEAVAARLKLLRTVFGMKTQTEMAEKLGVSVGRYGNVEWGQPLGRELATRICQAFSGITLDWLYFGNPAGVPLALAIELGEAQIRKTTRTDKSSEREIAVSTPTEAEIDPKVSEVASRLRSTRQALGLSQAALCSIAGLSPQTWNNAETGDARIGIDSAIKLCEATGVTLDWIYRGQRSGLPAALLQAIVRNGAEGAK